MSNDLMQRAVPDDHFLLGHLSRDIAALTSVATTDLDRPVVSCPGWRVADLMGHVGVIHHRTVGLLQGAEWVPIDACDPPPRSPDLLPWFHAGASAMLQALQSTDLSTVVSTPIGPQPARWWLRRMAHETVVHHWDLQQSIAPPGGVIAPVDAALAIDGIAEFFEVFVPRVGAMRWATVAKGQAGVVLRLSATDSDRPHWTVAIAPSGAVSVTDTSVADEALSAHVSVRADSSDLLLMIWNRVATTSVTVSGDADVLDRFLAAAAY